MSIAEATNPSKGPSKSPSTASPLTAADHHRAMADYSRAGEARALALGNRGPIRFDAGGRLDPAILDAYWTHGGQTSGACGRARPLRRTPTATATTGSSSRPIAGPDP